MPEKVQGTSRLVEYMRTLGMEGRKQRIAAAMGIPVSHLAGEGRDAASFTIVVSDTVAQNVINILGDINIADLRTNADWVNQVQGIGGR